MNPTRHSDIDKTKALLEAEKYDEAIVMLDQMLCQTPQTICCFILAAMQNERKGIGREPLTIFSQPKP